MKNKYKISILVIINLIFASCSTDITSFNNDSSFSSSSSSTTISSSRNEEPSLINRDEYNTFWNNTTDIRFDLKFSKASLKAIEENGTKNNVNQDIYFPCDVILYMNDEIYTFLEVGARRKGNMSKEDDFNLGRIHYKLSFSETFSDEEYDQFKDFKKSWVNKEEELKEREDRTLFGMEKIDLKFNRNLDPNYIRQSYANYIVRDFQNGFGINNNLARVTLYEDNSINFSDTYDVLECVDKIFIKRHFSKERSKGDLYKLSYTSQGKVDFTITNTLIKTNQGYTINSNAIGIEDNTKYYHPPYDLKTNKKSSNHEDLINFIEVLNTNESPSEEFEPILNSILDVDSFITFSGISWAIGDPDDLRSNYNNTYLYFDSLDHKAYFIGYDKDRPLGITYTGAGLMPQRRVTSTKCTGYSGDSYQSNPLFWRTVIISANGKDISKNYPVVKSCLIKLKEVMKKIESSPLFTSDYFDQYIKSSTYGMLDANAKENNNSFNEYLRNLKDKMKDEYLSNVL